MISEETWFRNVYTTMTHIMVNDLTLSRHSIVTNTAFYVTKVCTYSKNVQRISREKRHLGQMANDLTPSRHSIVANTAFYVTSAIVLTVITSNGLAMRRDTWFTNVWPTMTHIMANDLTPSRHSIVPGTAL